MQALQRTERNGPPPSRGADLTRPNGTSTLIIVSGASTVGMGISRCRAAAHS